MRNKKDLRMILSAALLCALSLCGLCGCGDDAGPTTEPISGGTTDLTDYDAPKVILSKDISDFSASFYLDNRWTAAENHDFLFRIKPDADGMPIAAEEISGISFAADDELLSALQAVIDEEELAAMNGVYRVTAGLAPGYQECELLVNYASGEKLSFTVNNDPCAEWAEMIYTVFADWFAAKGDDSLFPTAEDSPLIHATLAFKENGLYLRCSGITVGETWLLCRSVYDIAADEEISEEFIPFPEDYYERIAGIINSYDLVRKYDFSYFDHAAGNYGNHDEGYYGMGTLTTADGEADAADLSLSLHLEYESGKRINIDTAKASEIAGMRPMLNDLIAYHDTLF